MRQSIATCFYSGNFREAVRDGKMMQGRESLEGIFPKLRRLGPFNSR